MPEPRPEIAALGPAVHGGAPGALLDFSTGVAPLPPPGAICEAYAKADFTRYPHPTAEPLRRAAAIAHGCSPEEVVAGNGSVELIWALARAFVGPGRAALTVEPAFGEYAQAVRASGGRVTRLRLEGPPFALDWAPLCAAVRAERPHLVFLCRPANPGLYVPSLEGMEELRRAAPASLVVVDEAYLPLFDEMAPMRAGENLCILRSLTKCFALPGLRIGYLLADRAVARAVQAALPPWNVSAPAQAAGVAALGEPTAPVRAEVRRLREALVTRLGPPVAAGGPFLLYRVGEGARLAARLASHGIFVRDCTSFGLPDCVRVGVRPEPEQERLARAWRACR